MRHAVRSKLWLALACFALSGCDGVFSSIPDKLNRVFPPGPELSAEAERLRSVDSASFKQLEEHYLAQLQLRGKTCAQGVAIGRFASLDAVKAVPGMRECMLTQDAKVQQFLGLRLIGMRLVLGPLRPLVPLGPTTLVPVGGKAIHLGANAASAGVTVLQGDDGAHVSIAIPGGEKIASLPQLSKESFAVLLSPNGRVTATGTRGGPFSAMLFVDNETGATLWKSKDKMNFVAWLPGITGGLIDDNEQLAVIDFQAGTITAHPEKLRQPFWGIALGDAPSRVLIGNFNDATIVEGRRTRDGITATIDKSFPFTLNGPWLQVPKLMHGGKTIVYGESNGNLVAIDLASGKKTTWPTAKFLGSQFAKLSETTLLVEAFQAEAPQAMPMVFDIDAGTLAPVTSPEPTGFMRALTGRAGYMRKSGSQVWFGDQVSAGEATALGTLADAYHLAYQAKLDRLNPK